MPALTDFFVRQDPVYDDWCKRYQASNTSSKAVYLFLHLAPGIAGFCLVNLTPVYRVIRDLTGLDDSNYQYLLFILVTYGWHIATPFAILRWNDKLTFSESLSFLGLNRVDWGGLFIVLPLLFVPYTILSIPYFWWVVSPVEHLLSGVSFFQMPPHSIFAGDLYEFPIPMLLLLFIGNFLGEELYYRGYLMKKCAFLGKHTWWTTSVLFALYHLWQIPQTWPLIGPVIIFGIVMALRKDLYVAIALHFLLNLVWLPGMFEYFVP